MRVVHSNQLAQRIISVSRSRAIASFAGDITAIVIGVGEGDARLLDGRHQRSGTARAIAAIDITVGAAQGAGSTRGDTAKAIVSIAERIFPIEGHSGDAIIVVVGVGGAELLGRQGFLQRGQPVLSVVFQARAIDETSVGIAQLGIHQPVGK